MSGKWAWPGWIEKQRLPFPTLIPLDGKPLALATGKLQAGAKPVLALIVEQEGKGRSGGPPPAGDAHRRRQDQNSEAQQGLQSQPDHRWPFTMPTRMG